MRPSELSLAGYGQCSEENSRTLLAWSILVVDVPILAVHVNSHAMTGFCCA